MNYSDLLERIARWEDLHTEFKERLVHPDDVAPSLVALANTDGGQYIVGISKNRTFVGVDKPDEVSQTLDNIAANNCDPPITIIQEHIYPEDKPGHEAKPVIVINVPKGGMRPYSTNRGVYYIRTSSGRRQASKEELLRLFQAAESLYYDETPLIKLSLTDLDLNALDHYLETAGREQLKGNRQQLLVNWGLLHNGHPTVAGLLLFGREPQRHLPFAQINAARFPGSESSVEPTDRKDLTGRLLEVIDQAARFMDLHLKTPHEIRGFDPEPRPELPREALREAIVNAVAHRDYTVQSPVRLFIFDDRVEVHAPGKPPNTVDEGAMRFGVHVVRNPRIYSRLSEAGLVTGAGTGVPRMMRLVQEATGQDLGIRISHFETLIVLPRKAQ